MKHVAEPGSLAVAAANSPREVVLHKVQKNEMPEFLF